MALHGSDLINADFSALRLFCARLLPRVGRVSSRILGLIRVTVSGASHRFGWTEEVKPFLTRALLRRPNDSIGLLLAIFAAGVIASMGLLLGIAAMGTIASVLHPPPGPHPVPIFRVTWEPMGSHEYTGSVVAVMPRPVDLSRTKPEISSPRSRLDVISAIQRELERRGFYDGPIDGIDGPKTDAAIRDFLQSGGLKRTENRSEDLLRAIMRTPVKARSSAPRSTGRSDAIGDLIATSSGGVLAVQRALTDFGYGPVNPNGVFGVETKAAIERFERDRNLPVTGQISDRLIRELAAVTGRPLE